jgi:hypothetical protein
MPYLHKPVVKCITFHVEFRNNDKFETIFPLFPLLSFTPLLQPNFISELAVASNIRCKCSVELEEVAVKPHLPCYFFGSPLERCGEQGGAKVA